MAQEPLDLDRLALHTDRQSAEILNYLEGDSLSPANRIWGEEYHASGDGPKSPPEGGIYVD